MKEKERQNTIFIFLLLAGLSFFIFFFSPSGWFKTLRGHFEKPFLSLQRGVYGLKQKIFSPWRVLENQISDYQEKEKLEEEIKRLSVKVGELSVCLEENESLRRMLGAPLPASWHFIPARVLSHYQRFKINVGQKAGVGEGMMVVSQNLLVGRVVAVEKYSSGVVTVTEPNLKIPAVVRSPEEKGIKARGVLSGYLGKKLILSEVLKSEPVKVGDLVFSSGEGEWLPDLLIAKIDEIEEGDQKLFKRVLAIPLVEAEDLDHVFVVKIFQKES